MKMIPRLLGNVLVKMNKFPIQMTDNEKVVDKLNEVKGTVRFQLKKVLCMGTAVATCDHTPE
jgi:large subunit ribosomal protein L10Ae